MRVAEEVSIDEGHSVPSGGEEGDGQWNSGDYADGRRARDKDRCGIRVEGDGHKAATVPPLPQLVAAESLGARGARRECVWARRE